MMIFKSFHCLMLACILSFCHCKGVREDGTGRIKNAPRIYLREDVEDCIKKELSYDPNVNMSDYENLGIEYFNEIKDYVSEDAINIQNEIERFNKLLKERSLAAKDSLLAEGDTLKSLEQLHSSIDSLNRLIRNYRKITVGYVFVHSFRTGSDTMKNIFVMDINCNETDIIPVKAGRTINPDDYRRNVNQFRR
ncbi:MAG: hypothetical protein ACE5DN_04820 [Flavobacteriales bacterium]